MLRPLAVEADVAARWAATVERITRDHLLEPYRRDYLEGVRYAEFNRTLVQVMELLQVPGIGPVLDLAGRVVRVPIRLASEAVRRLCGTGPRRQDAPRAAWSCTRRSRPGSTALKAEAQALANAETHPSWAEIARQLDDETFRLALLGRLRRGLRRLAP